jgi:hypothetical protein
MRNTRNGGCANPATLKNEPADQIQVGPLSFARYIEPLDAPRKKPRYAWYSGEPCSVAEITRRAEALIKRRLVAGM